MEDEDLTKLTDISVERHDGVKSPATGIPFLIVKSAAVKDVNSVGGIDEKPDIAGAESILVQLAKLIEAEARELAVGSWDESCDIQTLSECISLMKWFKCREEMGDEDDGEGLAKSAEVVVKAHRKFSTDERKSLAGKGHALEDGSYPIPDEDALHRAAILARSHHGDWQAAEKLIAKRAKELKVPNPLHSGDTKKSMDNENTPTEPVEGSEVAKDALSKEAVEKMIEDATAEVQKAAEGRIEALTAELNVLKNTPIPAGLVMAAPGVPGATTQASAEAIAKAEHYERLSNTVRDRELIRFYRDKASALRKEAGQG